MAVNAIMWCAGTLQNGNSQKRLEEKVKLLLEGPLRDKDEYAQEKAIKSFSETIRYLESLMMYQNGIHRDQIDIVSVSNNPKVYQEKMELVEKTVEVELNRQMRHYLTFLN